MNYIAYPFHVEKDGNTARATYDDYIKGLIEQVLLTKASERVNRPQFGGGLLHAVFSPLSAELAAPLQVMVQGMLQQWLGDLIRIENVQVQSEGSTVTVIVQYTTPNDLTSGKPRETQVSYRGVDR